MPKGVYDRTGQGKRGPNTSRLFLKIKKVDSLEHRAVVQQTKLASASLDADQCPRCSAGLVDHECISCGFKFVVAPYSGPDTRKVRPEFNRRVWEK